MAIYIVPKRAQRMWDEWNLRGAVLLSLWLQILLILLAGMRKRTNNRVIIAIVWLAYLMADSVAVFAIGLIINNQSSDCEKASVNGDVGAFWASFLLLHLGGPDSITAFSIEDNKLWIRHLLGLVAEVSMVVYVLFLAIPNTFWIPSVLVFVAGTIKYAERSLALYRASSDHIYESARSITSSDTDQTLKMEEIDKENVVKLGYLYYNNIWSVGDGGVRYMEKLSLFDIISNYGIKSPQRTAFKIMEVELNFMYDEFFTKMGMLHRSCCLGYFVRVTCTALIASASLIFAFHKKPKREIHGFDVGVTYTLLGGAVILDIVALFKFICSDWMMVLMGEFMNSKVLRVMHAIKNKIFVAPRWCERIYQHNAISYHYWRREQRHRSAFGRWLIKKSGTFEELETLDIKYNRQIGEGLKDMVFHHIDKKTKRYRELLNDEIIRESVNEYRTQMDRRDGAIGDYMEKYNSKLKIVEWSLSDGVGYGDCICMWHIATDLLYRKWEGEEQGKRNDKDEDKPIIDRKACNILSNYLFYLLNNKRELMLSTSSDYSLNRFHVELSYFLKGKILDDIIKAVVSPNPTVGEAIVNVEDNQPVPVSYKILPGAEMLVKELNSMEDDDMWEMTKKVWLDLLVHGAANSKTTAHITQLSRGGELFTFVWLLLAHAKLTPIEIEHMKSMESTGGLSYVRNLIWSTPNP